MSNSFTHSRDSKDRRSIIFRNELCKNWLSQVGRFSDSGGPLSQVSRAIIVPSCENEMFVTFSCLLRNWIRQRTLREVVSSISTVPLLSPGTQACLPSNEITLRAVISVQSWAPLL